MLHRRPVLREPLGPEGRLEQPPLRPVFRVWAAAEAVAEEVPRLLVEQASFVEGPVVRQDLVQKVLVARHVGGLRAQPDLHQVTVLGQFRKELQGTAQQLPSVADKRERPWCGPRRELRLH